MSDETFDTDQVLSALASFLDYAKDEYGKSQQGYFSGYGWAARCLRYHARQLKESSMYYKNSNVFDESNG